MLVRKEINVTKTKEMITGLKVTIGIKSFKFNSNCLDFQARVLSGISMAVSKDPKIQNQFTLETLLSEKLSSKYQVSFLSSVLYRRSLVSREGILISSFCEFKI